METISFVIKFGDTTDPRKVAKEIANDLRFCDWMLKKSKKQASDEGIAATRYTIEGWSTEW